MKTIFQWTHYFSLTCLVAVVAAMLIYFFYQLDYGLLATSSPTKEVMARKLAKEKTGLKNLRFELVDPSDAPEETKDRIKRGYDLILYTHQLIPHYALHPINCTNCHFAGGITIGGAGGGISLAGVAAKYPRFNPARGRVEELGQRVNDCFLYSLNGKPLPLDSQEMAAILSYLNWISSSCPETESHPWLGLPQLTTSHQPNPVKGQAVYTIHCASCHGQNGEGTKISDRYQALNIPPLWGAESFNRQAGMGKIGILASFVYHNMPYEEPHLSQEEAFDVSAYILEQPRAPGPQ
ncbi:putative cytochrome c family protein [Chlamydiales bacterium STE3]|nr:putative cytochrome c family protein [Chlamydiales bacterium STE3]